MEKKEGRASSVEAFLAKLPSERRDAIREVRAVIRAHLPAGFAETTQFGMISYVIPLDTYPHTYNGQPLMLAALGSQKNHMALYLMTVYGDTPTALWFIEEYRKTGKKLDMGKACIRFRKLEDLPLELVGRAIARVSVKDYIAVYEKSRKSPA